MYEISATNAWVSFDDSIYKPKWWMMHEITATTVRVSFDL